MTAPMTTLTPKPLADRQIGAGSLAARGVVLLPAGAACSHRAV